MQSLNNEHSPSPEQLATDSPDSDTAPLGGEQDEGREEHSARISFDEDKVVASRVVDPSSSPDAQASSFAGDAERAEPECTKPVDKGKGKEKADKADSCDDDGFEIQRVDEQHVRCENSVSSVTKSVKGSEGELF